MARKEHEWEEQDDGTVRCIRCGMKVTKATARRGAGPCPGKLPVPNPDQEPVPDTPEPPAIDLDNPPDHIIHPGPKLTDPPEYCNACGDQLAILPLNSRLDMVACRNGRCSLYRERIRMVTKPVERGKRARSKGR